MKPYKSIFKETQKRIKQIFWGNDEGQFSEKNGIVRIDWEDGDVLTMQSDLFYNDWLHRNPKIKVIWEKSNNYMKESFPLLDKFLNKFPDNANSWSQATDELKDISRTAREYIEEFDGKVINPLNFKAFQTPSEWNSKSKEFIISTYESMSPQCKKQFEKYLKDHFNI